MVFGIDIAVYKGKFHKVLPIKTLSNVRLSAELKAIIYVKIRQKDSCLTEKIRKKHSNAFGCILI